MKLYEITQEIENFNWEIDEETGEILNTDKLNELEMMREEKIENIALLIKNLDSDIVALKEEEKNLATRRKGKEAKVESLKKYLSNNLCGEKFESARVRIGWRRSTKVEVDAQLIPIDFLKFEEPKPNKLAIKDALEKGVQVNGAQLVETMSMIIK